jgi:toxin CptA
MKGPDLTIEIGASRRLTYVVAAIHLLAVGAVLLAELSWSSRAPLILSLAMSMGFYLKTWPSRKVKLRCRADGGLGLRGAEDWDEARLLPDTLVLPWCGILRYQRSGRRRPETCIILPDSLNGDDFRRLRVWLKFRASALPASGDAY